MGLIGKEVYIGKKVPLLFTPKWCGTFATKVLFKRCGTHHNKYFEIYKYIYNNPPHISKYCWTLFQKLFYFTPEYYKNLMYMNWCLSSYEPAIEQLIVSHRNMVKLSFYEPNPFVWNRGLAIHIKSFYLAVLRFDTLWPCVFLESTSALEMLA